MILHHPGWWPSILISYLVSVMIPIILSFLVSVSVKVTILVSYLVSVSVMVTILGLTMPSVWNLHHPGWLWRCVVIDSTWWYSLLHTRHTIQPSNFCLRMFWLTLLRLLSRSFLFLDFKSRIILFFGFFILEIFSSWSTFISGFTFCVRISSLVEELQKWGCYSVYSTGFSTIHLTMPLITLLGQFQ